MSPIWHLLLICRSNHLDVRAFYEFKEKLLLQFYIVAKPMKNEKKNMNLFLKLYSHFLKQDIMVFLYFVWCETPCTSNISLFLSSYYEFHVIPIPDDIYCTPIDIFLTIIGMSCFCLKMIFIDISEVDLSVPGTEQGQHIQFACGT